MGAQSCVKPQWSFLVDFHMTKKMIQPQYRGAAEVFLLPANCCYLGKEKMLGQELITQENSGFALEASVKAFSDVPVGVMCQLQGP